MEKVFDRRRLRGAKAGVSSEAVTNEEFIVGP
jgi:hypothetical protein